MHLLKNLWDNTDLKVPGIAKSRMKHYHWKGSKINLVYTLDDYTPGIQKSSLRNTTIYQY